VAFFLDRPSFGSVRGLLGGEGIWMIIVDIMRIVTIIGFINNPSLHWKQNREKDS